MRGFVDLHSHWVAGVDDGVKSADDGRALLIALRRAGFDHVVATPHMRPGMFENDAGGLVAAYQRTRAAIGASEKEPVGELPRVSLASEHYFDDVVFGRIVSGDALPYPGAHCVLVELPTTAFPARLQHRLADLVRHGKRPVIAHPERYEPVWKDVQVLEPLLDVGALLLLDIASLAGKYGRSPRKAAEKLVDEGFYYAACSDAHRAADVDEVVAGLKALTKRAGEEETRFLLTEGPNGILSGSIQQG
ncbi:MAG: CpsB/CapC family capsule biosynthesis tyrosine phosphatase [Polyangiaceae bacterium]